MARRKRKLTAAEKRARRERKKNFMFIFVRGKQKRVPRPPTIDGMSVDEFIRRNADPIWLHQNEMWEYIETDEPDEKDGLFLDPGTEEEPPDRVDGWYAFDRDEVWGDHDGSDDIPF